MESRRDRGRWLATTAPARMASRKAAAVATAILLLAFLALVWANASPAENGAGGEPAAHAWRESEEASGEDGSAGSAPQDDASGASEPAAKGDQTEDASANRGEATRKGAGATSLRGDAASATKPGPEGSSEQGTAAHKHNWVAQTKTVHHDAQYKTVHHDAVTHQVWHDAVTESRSICNGCGSDITGNERSHAKAAALAGNYACGSCHSEPRTMKPGYYETVTDKAAYNEQVQTSAAWDETVTTGYKCSGCGATK